MPSVSSDPDRQCFLFLQGPISPFFADLAEALEAQGHRAIRVNLNMGDRLFWRGPAVDYRGGAAGWPSMVASLMDREGVTDLLLLGEQRPHHRAAITAAHARGIRITVFDYGYLRPDWITCEPDGMGSLSRFPRTLDGVRALARTTGPVDSEVAYSDAFGRQARWDVIYHLASAGLRCLYPGYRSHQIYDPLLNYIGTGWRLLMRSRRSRAAEQAIATLARGRRPLFLFPMQMEVDYSIRAYSSFGGMREPLERVIASFLEHAPPDATLVVKLHPLDPGLRRWGQWLRKAVARLHPTGCDRVVFIDGGSLQSLLSHVTGVVTVNSTTGVAALQAGVPVLTLGAAIYDIEGLTWQEGLDAFWTGAIPPNPDDVTDFVRALVATVQLRGVFYTEPGLNAAVRAVSARLAASDQARIAAMLDPSRLALQHPKAPRAAILEPV